MAETKHSWTEQELWVVCVCYKENLPIELALRLTNTTNVKSMEMRYQNCLYLDKGPVEGSLSHASKTLVKVWEEVENLYDDVDPLNLTQPVEQQPVIVKEEESNMTETMLTLLFFMYLMMIIRSMMVD